VCSKVMLIKRERNVCVSQIGLCVAVGCSPPSFSLEWSSDGLPLMVVLCRVGGPIPDRMHVRTLQGIGSLCGCEGCQRGI